MKIDKRLVRCIVILLFAVVLCMLVAKRLCEVIPDFTDEVTLTAQGTHSDESKLDEIVYLGYSVGAGGIAPAEDLVSGKWFWRGDDAIMWRNESDSRQPEGVTRSVVIDVPVGKDRSLNFESSEWCGYVEISSEYDTATIDTYSASQYSLPDSSGGRMALKLLRVALIYMGVFVLMALLMWALYKKSKAPDEEAAEELWHKLVYAMIAIFTVWYFQSFADIDSFWCDELAQYDFVSGSFRHSVTADPHTPPLYNMLMWAWLRLTAADAKWLLFPGEVFVAIGIYIIARTGKLMHGFRCGLLAELFCFVNINVADQCANEFRSYALLFMAASVVIYHFVKYMKTRERRRADIASYAVWLSVLAYSHYFGLFMIVPIFIWDFIYFCRRKVKLSFVIPYVIAGITYLPWIYFVLTYDSEVVGTWQGTPDINSVYSLIKYLCGGTDYVYCLAVIGAGLCIYEIVRAFRDREELSADVLMLFVIGSIIAGVYIYATRFGYKSTFWCDRYFVCLEPCAYLLFAGGVARIAESFKLKPEIKYAVIFAMLFIVAVPEGLSTKQRVYRTEPFEAAADMIYNESNYCFNSDTLILYCDPAHWFCTGWQQLYITDQGKRDNLNVVDSITAEELASYSRVYVMYIHGFYPPSDIQSILDTEFTLKSDNAAICVKTYDRSEE